jgi:ABC-type uncharacterized transport system permease subunit
MSLIWLRLAAALYAAGLVQAIFSVFRRGDAFYPFAMHLFHIGVVVHGVSIVEHSFALKHLAANNFFETASLCAFLFAVVYLFVQRRYNFQGLSIFAFPLIA